ncbi:hypothetical protein [Enterococcus faecalis]|uniref:hypothetical protein n=1 Tax=Enterococcus TaxID=1350 RepID=UPI0003300E27|nr:hypothetical protein [Enterococcus faecalis]EOJ79206.1 hypothetical protein WOA_02077 [Enterococcus faecalis EnGen0356]MDK0526613.1 hypothetical protein [Enterococcus faecalis]RBR82785.1 hypothetical protein EB53_00653 [Enterococcus faecalis]WHK55342.1 hypothetical protein QLQ38_08120 [Enterococcus faecalis]
MVLSLNKTTEKFEDSVSRLTSAIETGDAGFSGGYKDGVISGSITFNMTKNTVDGTEITTSVKYNLEIDLGKIGKPFQDVLDWIQNTVVSSVFGWFLFVSFIIVCAGAVMYAGAALTSHEIITLIVSAVTFLASSIKF